MILTIIRDIKTELGKSDEQLYDEIMMGYDDYELPALEYLWELIKNLDHAFNYKQAERLMLDAYYRALKRPSVGYVFYNEDETDYVSPTRDDFFDALHAVLAKHTYHADIAERNAKRLLRGLQPIQPKYPLTLSYEE